MQHRHRFVLIIMFSLLASILIACQTSIEATAIAPTATVFVENPAYLAAMETARTHHAQGNYQAALDDFTRAIEIAPDIPIAYNERGSSYVAMGNYHAALADFSRAIMLAPDFEPSYFKRGMVYSDYHYRNFYANNEAALADFNRVIELAPDNAFAYALRANIHYHLGNAEAALADWYQAEALGYELASDMLANRDNLQDD